jgi:hypothetical protein
MNIDLNPSKIEIFHSAEFSAVKQKLLEKETHKLTGIWNEMMDIP